jgi:hypothetical protein
MSDMMAGRERIRLAAGGIPETEVSTAVMMAAVLQSPAQGAAALTGSRMPMPAEEIASRGVRAAVMLQPAGAGRDAVVASSVARATDVAAVYATTAKIRSAGVTVRTRAGHPAAAESTMVSTTTETATTETSVMSAATEAAVVATTSHVAAAVASSVTAASMSASTMPTPSVASFDWCGIWQTQQHGSRQCCSNG